MPFPLNHDVENHGFLLVGHSGDKLCYITDTAYSKYRFKKINYYLVECNHVRSRLEGSVKAGVISRALRDRIIKTHFEIENVKKFFRASDMSECREIHLLHLSDNNGDPELFISEIEKLTGKPVFIKGAI